MNTLKIQIKPYYQNNPFNLKDDQKVSTVAVVEKEDLIEDSENELESVEKEV